MFFRLIACHDNYYGYDCQNKCSTRCHTQKRCDKFTGHCVGGCQAGWQGPKCDERNYFKPCTHIENFKLLKIMCHDPIWICRF